MWRQMMQVSLIGAAVTMTAPDGAMADPGLAAGGEAAAQGDSLCRSPGKQMWREGEPRLSAMLDDPIVRLVMQRDGVSREDLVEVIETARAALVDRSAG